MAKPGTQGFNRERRCKRTTQVLTVDQRGRGSTGSEESKPLVSSRSVHNKLRYPNYTHDNHYTKYNQSNVLHGTDEDTHKVDDKWDGKAQRDELP